MTESKSLADLIVEEGPYATVDRLVSLVERLDGPDEINALRDELIELRALRAWFGQIEAPGSALCDCADGDDYPTSPDTGARMAHHCDCAAVEAAGTLFGGRDKTRHAVECSCCAREADRG